MKSVKGITDKYNYCRECGRRIEKGVKTCPVCAVAYKEKYMLIVDVGTYHVEINTAQCTDFQISRVISAACKKAKQMQKEAKQTQKG